MCGILGWISIEGSSVKNEDYLSGISKLLKISELRGKEASGVCVANDKEIAVLKECVSAGQLVKGAKYRKFMSGYLNKNQGDYRCCIGHARMVTNGDAGNSNNNQPVISGDLVCVHNGIIVNDAELWDKHKELKREYEVDTEILLKLIAQQEEKMPYKALCHAMREIEGGVSVALLSARHDSLTLFTNIGSLYYVFSKRKKDFVFASERYILECFIKKAGSTVDISKEDICQITPGDGMVIGLHDLEKNAFSLKGTGLRYEDVTRKKARRIVDRSGSRQNVNRNSAACRINSCAGLEKLLKVDVSKIRKLRRCTKCLLPETFPGISYDENGVCSVCRSYKKIQYAGAEKLKNRLCVNTGNEKTNYDALVLLSGGRDSCYAIHYLVKELGLKVVAYTYDWGMVTDLARRNIQRMCSQLEVEHILISADISQKRSNIRKNVAAWLSRPSLGTVPLFMAGDKEYFYHAHRLKDQMKINHIVLGINPLEATLFKAEFAHASTKQTEQAGGHYRIGARQQANMLLYYAGEVLKNPKYVNSSVWDTLWGYFSYYIMPHNKHTEFFRYIPWNEDEINRTLIGQYNWECAKDTKDTWRIGDGTAAFYNYIYYKVAGFTEFDTFRSNQIREGLLSREKAIEMIEESNMPRMESFAWYCDTIGLNAVDVAKIINKIPTLY